MNRGKDKNLLRIRGKKKISERKKRIVYILLLYLDKEELVTAKVKSDIWWEKLYNNFDASVTKLGYLSGEVCDLLELTFNDICDKIEKQVGDFGNVVSLETDLTSRLIKVVTGNKLVSYELECENIDNIVDAVRKDLGIDFTDNNFYCIVLSTFSFVAGELCGRIVRGDVEISLFEEIQASGKSVEDFLKESIGSEQLIVSCISVRDIIKNLITGKFRWAEVSCNVVGDKIMVEDISELEDARKQCFEVLKNDLEFKALKVDPNNLVCSNVGFNGCNEIVFIFEEDEVV